MALSKLRVMPRMGVGDRVMVLADSGDVRVIATIARGVVDDAAPSRLTTSKQREDFIERNLADKIERVIEARFDAGQFEVGGRGGHQRFIKIEAADLRGLELR